MAPTRILWLWPIFLLLVTVAGGTAQPDTTASGPAQVDELLRRALETRGNDPRLCLQLAQRALELAKDYDLSDQHIGALTGIGVAHYFLGDYSLALEHYQQARELAETVGARRRTADILNNIGVLYFIWGEHDRALDYYLESLAIHLDMNDTARLGPGYNNVANIYQTAGDYEKALDYYQNSLEIYEANADTSQIASCLNNIGLLFYDQSDYDRSLSTYARALVLEQQINDKPGMALSLNNMGQVHEAQGDLDEAMIQYQAALALRRDLGDRQGISVCLHNIGVIHVELEAYELGIDYVQQALDLAQELEIQELIRDDLQSLAEAYEKAGDYEQALHYFRRYKDAHDEIFSAERFRQIGMAQTRFEVDLKDREIEALKRETEIERFRRQLLLIVAGLALVIIILLLNRYLFQRRAHQEIARTNDALRQAHSELEQAARDELAHVARVATMGELAAAFAHELNQPLAAIRANARAGRNFLDHQEPDTSEVDGALGDIGEDAERAQDIIIRLRNMMRKSDQKRRSVDLNQVIHAAAAMIRTEAGRQGTALELHPAPDLPSVSGDRIQLQQVVLNLIQNGLAAMDGLGGALTITTKPSASEGVHVAITDTGMPVSRDVANDMFEPFFTTKPDGLGMGLPICRTIIESHEGTITAAQNEHGGMTVSFELPGAGRLVT